MRNCHRGQTLIEVFITLFLISIGVVGLLQANNYLSYSNHLTQQKNEALLLANRQIEQVKSYQVLNNSSGYSSYQNIASTSSVISGNSAIYTITSLVTTYTNPNYKRIDLTISWIDQRNITQSIQITTQIAGYDPLNSASII